MSEAANEGEWYGSGARPSRQLFESWFGPQRYRAVPWTIWEVLLLAPMVISGVWRGLAPSALGLEQADRTETQFYVIFNEIALLLMLIMPFAVILVRRAKLYQMGLHLHGWSRCALAGFLAYFIAAPFVFTVNFLALKLFVRTPHAIEDLLKTSPTVPRFVEAAIMAVVLAPILEEIGFRGILLPWLRKVIGPMPAILVSSAIFAVAHLDAWPAPIALFVLSLFLGYLAHRSSSLIAPLVLHATFNAANLALLIVIIVSDAVPAP